MSELPKKRFEHKKPKYYHTCFCFNAGEMESIPYDTPEEVEASILTAIHDPSWQCPFCLERPTADYRAVQRQEAERSRLSPDVVICGRGEGEGSLLIRSTTD